MLIDPRRGDIEDDSASPGQRSLLAIAGSLLLGVISVGLFALTALTERIAVPWKGDT